MLTIQHKDGTEYKVERRGSGRWYDTYFVYSVYGMYRVYANNPHDAVSKARENYAKTALVFS